MPSRSGGLYAEAAAWTMIAPRISYAGVQSVQKKDHQINYFEKRTMDPRSS